MTDRRARAVSIALPSEHGGWSLTLEPVLLGLLVAPSPAGFALGFGALTAFVLRSPLRVLLVDRYRGRALPRTRLAGGLVAAELAVLAVFGALAVIAAEHPFWWPVVAAAPLVAIALWFDTRSRSRRLAPELAGTIGIGAVAAAIALAGGESASVAGGLWLVAGARAVAAIPFVRVQLLRAKAQPHRLWHSDLAQVVALMSAGIGALTGVVPAPAMASVAVLAVVELAAVRMRPPTAPVLGAQQVALGLTVVLVTGLAVRSG